MGTAPLGWLFESVSDEQAHEALLAAAVHGIGYVDTAPSYGLGLAERRVGRFLAELRARRQPLPIVSTKIGRRVAAVDDDAEWTPAFPGAPRARMTEAWSRDGVMRGFEESLERLGVDRVDILLIHDADEVEDLVYHETFPAVRELREQGLVSRVGFGLNWPDVATRFVQRLDVDIVLLAGRYTLLDDSAADEFLPACLDSGTGVIAASPFNTGILAQPDPGPEARFNYRPAPAEMIARARRIAVVGKDHGVSLPMLAAQYPLTHPAVESVVIGMRNPDEAALNARLFDTPVPQAAWDDLRAEGLIERGA